MTASDRGSHPAALLLLLGGTLLGGLVADAIHGRRERQALVFVASDPPGASIEVDGAVLDDVTPHAVGGLSGGRHMIRVATPGRMAIERIIDLAASEHTEVHVTLPSRT